MALVDLWFADDKTKKIYDCKFCLKNPAISQKRKCQEPEYWNTIKPIRLDEHALGYSFCPGLALKNEEALELFKECRIAMETGLLPDEGTWLDQSDVFSDVFFEYLQRWKHRQYIYFWSDIKSFTKSVLEAIFGKKKGGR